MLAEDRTVILKFWMHMPKKEHRNRLKKVQSDSASFAESIDWTIFDNYDEAMPLVENYIQKTDTPHAPWRIIESTDRRHRDLAVAETIYKAIHQRLDHIPAPKPRNGKLPRIEIPDALAAVDLSNAIKRDDYKDELTSLQTHLVRLSHQAAENNISAAVVFEGWDAAGKGGAIRRITQALQARLYRVWSISAPNDRDLSHHYLWRFWTRLPRGGKLAIFDRSWYGRVLVERVEGFASTPEWRRAFAEINDFEQQLVEHGWPVIKFWLHIDPDEQLRRFEERRRTPYKKYKITDEDYRNRERWNDYVEAANEMFARTHTDHAPWHLIPANDKRLARVEVLRIVSDQLEQALKK